MPLDRGGGKTETFLIMNAIAQIRTLREAGLSDSQAEAILGVVEQAGEAGDLKKWATESLATKRDIAELETRLTVRMFTAGLTFAGIVLAGVYFLFSTLAK